MKGWQWFWGRWSGFTPDGILTGYGLRGTGVNDGSILADKMHGVLDVIGIDSS